MSWRDFFYFSKGERNALILLLCLITIAGVILILTNSPSSEPVTPSPTVSQQNNPEMATSASDMPSDAISSLPQPVSSRQTATPRESTSDRISRITSTQPSYTRIEKFSPGTTVELNSVDTTDLKKIPGIGSAFANRIVRYRDLLGGYYTVQQLAEVYGID